MTVTSKQAHDRFGDPNTEKFMVVYDVPPRLEIGAIPKRIYCNLFMIKPLERAFENLIKTGHVAELKTWDGCFNIRAKRTGESMSLHSWGLAIDLNANWNRLDRKPTLGPGFVKCFTDAGFEWGGNWSRPDGMHFQLAELPPVGAKA
jgi:hypothetical protein